MRGGYSIGRGGALYSQISWEGIMESYVVTNPEEYYVARRMLRAYFSIEHPDFVTTDKMWPLLKAVQDYEISCWGANTETSRKVQQSPF